MFRLEGLIAAPFGTLHKDESLNFDIIPRYIDHLAKRDVGGLFVCGSTGEGPSLSFSEKKQVIEQWGAAPTGNMKKIAMTGGTSVAECMELAALAAEHHYDAVAVCAPYYYKPLSLTQAVDFCVAVGRGVPELPLYYYHIPFFTGTNFSMFEFLQAIDNKLPSFSGIKFTHENLMDYKLCLDFENEKYDILWGRDEILLSALALGAKGFIGSTYNFIAPLYHRVIGAFRSGDIQTASAIQAQIMQIIHLIGKYGGLASQKYMMLLAGIDCGPARLPLQNLQASSKKSLETDLRETVFFDSVSPHTGKVIL
jgi:N-acetylneuraminate lyase